MKELLNKIGGRQEFMVLKDKQGFYIGLSCPIDGPFYRDSACHWDDKGEAERALASRDWPKERSNGH